MWSEGDDGEAYLFQIDSEAGTWNTSPTLVYRQNAFDTPNARFGWSVAIAGDQILVAALGHWLAAGGEASTDDDGYAYLFDRDTGEYIDKLQPPSPRPHPNDRFGWSSVAVRDDKVLITASPDPALAGDLNDDGFVGSADLDIVRANWGATVEPGDLSAGDADGDGQVNSADLDVIRANWGAMWDPSSGCGYLFEVADAKLLQTFPQPQTAAYEFFRSGRHGRRR